MGMMDDWYVLDASQDEFILVYYRGDSIAWKGCGGATLYTRDGTVPSAGSELLNRVQVACQRAGLDFTNFQPVDNSCKGQDTIQVD